MSKITMKEVYRQLEDYHYDTIEEAKERGDEVLRFDFKDFTKAMRSDDFITTIATTKNKWDSMIADGVIHQLGNEPYSRGLLVIKEFDRIMGKRVCACVCEKTPQAPATKGVRA